MSGAPLPASDSQGVPYPFHLGIKRSDAKTVFGTWVLGIRNPFRTGSVAWEDFYQVVLGILTCQATEFSKNP